MHNEDSIMDIKRQQGRLKIRTEVAALLIEHGGEKCRAAGVALQAAAYLAGSQYDDESRRKMAVDEIAAAFWRRIDANEAFAPLDRDIAESAMNLDSIKTQAELHASVCHEAAHRAKRHEVCPLDAAIAVAEVSASLLVAWVRRSDKPDTVLKDLAKEILRDFSAEFSLASDKGADARRKARQDGMALHPQHGWRGTSEEPETSPARGHMPIPCFLHTAEVGRSYHAY
jgi:hypothetical protein